MQEKGLRQNQVGNAQAWFYPAAGLWCCGNVFSIVSYGISSYSLTIWPVSFAPIGLLAEIRANPCVFHLVSYLIYQV